MDAFFDGLTAFGQPLTMAAVLMRIAVAVLIGAVIGIDREIKNRPAGMRTHVLVCVGAALVSMIECQSIADAVALGNASIGVSMGRITMPHQLARLVLTEQIYRACTINAGMKYHK